MLSRECLHRWMRVTGLMIAAGGTFPLASASARPVQLETTDGRTITGELIARTDEAVVVNIHGIEATLDSSQVAVLRDLETPATLYEKRRAEMDDADLAGRLGLVVAMYEREALDLAHKAVMSVLADFPDSREAAEMQRLIEARQKLTHSQVARASTQGNPALLEQSPLPRRMQAGRARPIENQPLLTEEQLNVVKVYEVKLESEPRIIVPAATLDKLFTDYASSPRVPKGKKEQADFKKRPGYEQLGLIFDVQARELYEQVLVKTEPEALAEFRRTVNNGYVSDYFEPTFGRGQVEGFSLLNGRADAEPVAYTNFFLLNRFDRGGFRMIDRDSPADSLLLQWGLPREAARNPAPEVDGWKPRFRNTEDAEYQRVLSWIDTLVKHSSYDFGLTYPSTPAGKK